MFWQLLMLAGGLLHVVGCTAGGLLLLMPVSPMFAAFNDFLAMLRNISETVNAKCSMAPVCWELQSLSTGIGSSAELL